MSFRTSTKSKLQFIKRLVESELGAEVELEFQFAKDIGRKWRFDLAMPEHLIALEADGGLFIGGGHNRGKVIVKTHEKENEAAMRGWLILKCQPEDVSTGRAFTLIVNCYNGLLTRKSKGGM